MYYTYMIRCADNSIYTGITTDIERRIEEHKNKTKECAKYTKNHNFKNLEALWISNNRILASKLEYHIKHLTKKEKEELIIKNNLNELLENKINPEDYTRKV